MNFAHMGIMNRAEFAHSVLLQNKTDFIFTQGAANHASLRVALIYYTISKVELAKSCRARVEKGDELCNYSVSCKS